MSLLLLDMNRPYFRPHESSRFSADPYQNDFRGYMSHPTKYYNRPPHPADCGRTTVRSQWPATVQPHLQAKNSFSTFSRNSLQHTTCNVSAKKSVSDQWVDVSVPASTSTASGTTEQLKWKPGEGPSVQLRLLIAGKVVLYTVCRKTYASIFLAMTL